MKLYQKNHYITPSTKFIQTFPESPTHHSPPLHPPSYLTASLMLLSVRVERTAAHPPAQLICWACSHQSRMCWPIVSSSWPGSVAATSCLRLFRRTSAVSQSWGWMLLSWSAINQNYFVCLIASGDDGSGYISKFPARVPYLSLAFKRLPLNQA